MEISGKVLREVEFRDRLRGYDTDEVDEFLEKVAVAVDELRAEMEQLSRRAERAEQHAEEAERAPAPRPVVEPSFDDDALRRTLVLAQRTADLAVAEAREQAAKLLDQAKSEADTVLAQAEDHARRTRSEAEQDVSSRLARLGEERDRLEGEVQSLTRLVESERARLTEALSSALRLVGETLSVSEDLSAHSAPAAQTPAAQTSAAQPLSGQPVPSPAAVSGLVEDEPSFTARLSGPDNAEGPEASPYGAGSSETAAGAGGGEQPGRSPGEQAPRMGLLPDVESEIAEDAAAAYGGDYPPATGKVRPLPAEEDDGDEELWQRWAAGRDLGVVPGPSDFPRTEHRFGQGPGGGLTA